MSQNDQIPVIQLQKMPTGGSDATLKKGITILSGGLEKVRSLRPVTWYWKTDEKNEELNYGFIAQEVEDVLPDLVNDDTWHDGTTRKFLAVGDMTPYVVSAIKEQADDVADVTKQIAELIQKIRSQQDEIMELREKIESITPISHK